MYHKNKVLKISKFPAMIQLLYVITNCRFSKQIAEILSSTFFKTDKNQNAKKIHIWSHFSEQLGVTRMNKIYRKTPHLCGFFEQFSAINKVKMYQKLIPNKNPLPNFCIPDRQVYQWSEGGGWLKKTKYYKQTQQKKLMINFTSFYLSQQKLCEITRH